jgi:hypothetical protein
LNLWRSYAGNPATDGRQALAVAAAVAWIAAAIALTFVPFLMTLER